MITIKRNIFITGLLIMTAKLSLAYYGQACGFKVKLANPQSSGVNNQQLYSGKNHSNDSLQPIQVQYNIKDNTHDSYTIDPYSPGNQGKRELPYLPKIGVWMQFKSDFLIENLKKIGEPYTGEPLSEYIPAAWLYWIGNNQGMVQTYSQPAAHIIEPINFLFVVNAENRSTANHKLTTTLNNMDYTTGEGSTNVYAGLFASQDDESLIYIDQLPGTYVSHDHSNQSRSHFRLLGPYQLSEKNWYLYSASVSIESSFYQRKTQQNHSAADERLNCGHMYVSFNQAKNKLVYDFVRLKHSQKKQTDGININGIYSINLHNTLPLQSGNKDESNHRYYTGDHQKALSTGSDYSYVVILK